MSTRDLVVLVAYFLAMLIIGLLCMRRVHGQEDYFMGGRKAGRLLQTFAAFGAGTGSSDPVNAARTTFTSGLSGMWSVMFWLFVTPFYWFTAVWYRRMRHLTLGDWYAERYDSRSLGAAYAIFALLFYMVYGSMMFSGVGKVAAPLIGADHLMLFGHSVELRYLLVPAIGVAVLAYGLTGGLKAAYWTDLIQGIFILILSVVLIPFGLLALVERFGDPATAGAMDGFRLLHQQVAPERFDLVGSGTSAEFPLHRIVAVVLINLVGVAVHPHMIATGGGSARNENAARLGLVTGNFLKRLCTVGWAFTALIVLGLFADHAELAQHPDRVWGVAARELLGPLNLGLVGLMLACLLAALMSTLDAYMLVGSALVVRNLYVPYVNPHADERQCLRAGRLTGVVIVGGSIAVALSIWDMWAQLKLSWEVPVVFAAAFWAGILWRRTTRLAAWVTVLCSAVVFFVLPWAAPQLWPELREDARYQAVTERVVTTTTRPAAPADVARRTARIREWEASGESPGPRPEPLTLGALLTETSQSGGKPLFWSRGVEAFDAADTPLEFAPVGPPEPAGERTTRQTWRLPEGARRTGQGHFQVHYLVYAWMGFDLAGCSDAVLHTLELPPKILGPFLLIILLSWVTPRVRRDRLDRYYAKMRTVVAATPEEDQRRLAEAWADAPARAQARKWFPRSNLEVERPTRGDVVGFAVCVGICFAILGLALFLARLGAPG